MFRKKSTKDTLAGSFGKVKNTSFDFDSISKYFYKKDHSGSYQVISDRTCKDLDFEEFFMFADRTLSKPGQQYLYDTLRTIPKSHNHLQHNESVIDQLSNNESLRINIQKLLSKLSNDDAYYVSSLFQDEHISKPKWFFLLPILSFTSLISIFLIPYFPQFFFLLLCVFILNIGFHYWNKRNLYEYVNAIPQLLRLGETAKALLKLNINTKKSNNVSSSVEIINQIRLRMLFFKLEAKLESDAVVFFWSLLEGIKILFLLEPLLLFGVLKRINNNKKEIRTVFTYFAEVDMLYSIASLRHGLASYCLPNILTDKQKVLSATELSHPLIPDCVPNTIHVTEKSVLITGSNMSGKTSFIRSIGLNILTAFTINTCFANSFKVSPTKLYTAIRMSDNLMEDKSYYLEEVTTVKQLLIESSLSPCLFLLDELFKGTNTIERIAAGKSVLSHLDTSKCLVFASTHDIEIADMLTSQYDFYYFSETIEKSDMVFDYLLKHGKLHKTNAIRILQLNGYPSSLVEEAYSIANRLQSFVN